MSTIYACLLLSGDVTIDQLARVRTVRMVDVGDRRTWVTWCEIATMTEYNPGDIVKLCPDQAVRTYTDTGEEVDR